MHKSIYVGKKIHMHIGFIYTILHAEKRILFLKVHIIFEAMYFAFFYWLLFHCSIGHYFLHFQLTHFFLVIGSKELCIKF